MGAPGGGHNGLEEGGGTPNNANLFFGSFTNFIWRAPGGGRVLPLPVVTLLGGTRFSGVQPQMITYFQAFPKIPLGGGRINS